MYIKRIQTDASFFPMPGAGHCNITLCRYICTHLECRLHHSHSLILLVAYMYARTYILLIVPGIKEFCPQIFCLVLFRKKLQTQNNETCEWRMKDVGKQTFFPQEIILRCHAVDANRKFNKDWTIKGEIRYTITVYFGMVQVRIIHPCLDWK
jgi:hypothetical protein